MQTAYIARSVTTVSRLFTRQCTPVLPFKEVYTNAAIYMRPGQDLVRTAFPARIEARVNTALIQRTIPFFEPEKLAPGIQFTSHSPRPVYDTGYASVTA